MMLMNNIGQVKQVFDDILNKHHCYQACAYTHILFFNDEKYCKIYILAANLIFS